MPASALRTCEGNRISERERHFQMKCSSVSSMKTNVGGAWRSSCSALVGGRSAAVRDHRSRREDYSVWLAASLVNRPVDRVHRPSAGRPSSKNAADAVGTRGAGRPRNGRRSDECAEWIRSSLCTFSVKLEAAGHAVRPATVGRLLRKLDYSQHVTVKKIEASSNHPVRQQQFDYIAVDRAAFTAAGLPDLPVSDWFLEARLAASGTLRVDNVASCRSCWLAVRYIADAELLC